MKLECDHVVARANGGSDDIGNLLTSCRECNIGKRTTAVIAPPKKPISSCHICEWDIFEGDDYEGWDTDDICRGCINVVHAESDARLAAENAEINAWIVARGVR